MGGDRLSGLPKVGQDTLSPRYKDFVSVVEAAGETLVRQSEAQFASRRRLVQIECASWDDRQEVRGFGGEGKGRGSAGGRSIGPGELGGIFCLQDDGFRVRFFSQSGVAVPSAPDRQVLDSLATVDLPE